MQQFINFLTQFRVYIIFAALVIISLSLISIGNTNKIGGFRTIVAGTVGWMQHLFSWIPNPVAIKSENASLREQNIELSYEVTKLRQALIENKRYKALLQVQEEAKYPYILADVVGRNIIETRSYITLNRGKKHGALEGMSVRSDAGLVGIIIAVSDNYSVVELINNRDIKIAARLERSRFEGILVWEGGEKFLLKNIPSQSDRFDMDSIIKINDYIVTSNNSNRFPSNIPLGKIVNVEKVFNNLFLKVYVQPLANLETLEQVFIIQYIPDKERNQLITEVENKLRLRKK